MPRLAILREVPAPESFHVAAGARSRAREANAGAPGPSFLEIPRDVLDARVPVSTARVPQAGHYRASTRSVGDPADIEKLADLLVNARKPAILLGSQVWTTRATDSAIELVRTLNVPAYMNGAGRGTHDGSSGISASGSGDISTRMMSTPEMPSIMQW